MYRVRTFRRNLNAYLLQPCNINIPLDKLLNILFIQMHFPAIKTIINISKACFPLLWFRVRPYNLGTRATCNCTTSPSFQVQGNNSLWVYCISALLEREVLTDLCSRLSFQGSLYHKQALNIETVSLFRAKGRFA